MVVSLLFGTWVVVGALVTDVLAQRGAPRASPEREADLDAATAALGEAGHGPTGEIGCPRGAVGLRCMLERFYADAPDAQQEALSLFDRHGIVAGVEAAWTMDGGFRGTIRILPSRPVGRDVRHLRWVRAAHDAIARLLASVEDRATRPLRYRHRGLVYAFFRSERRTTPSAYAANWRVGYNVVGSLNRSETAVRATLVHEIFHLNDQADAFTQHALVALHARILGRCGTDRRCLAPYAPTDLTVRGGTYYAFQPNNGEAVAEYGADLASRWFAEQSVVLEGRRLAERPWKCRTPENATAYRLVVDAFFGGVDLTPACER